MSLTSDIPKAEMEKAVAPPEAKPTVPVDIESAPKTRGEWFYDVLQFTVGKAMIIAATAVIAFVAHPKYGPEKLGPVPNFMKKFQSWFHNKLLHNKIYPMGDHGEITTRIAGAAANTMMTFHGGNVFAPIMKWMENSRMEIAGWANRQWGKPGDEAISNERLKDTPQQNWWDVVKGRLAAWAIVFSGFMAADLVIGKGKVLGWGREDKYRFDQYEDAVGRWLAGFTKSGKQIAKTPIHHNLSDTQKDHKWYQFGKIMALDVYATSIAIGLWTMVSRMSAQKRHEKINGNGKEKAEAPPADLSPPPVEIPVTDKEIRHSEGMEPRGASVSAKEKSPDPSHGGAILSQRQRESGEQPQLG